MKLYHFMTRMGQCWNREEGYTGWSCWLGPNEMNLRNWGLAGQKAQSVPES